MMHKRLVLTVLLLTLCVTTFAQQFNLSGVVKDKDGLPLYAASVAVDGTTRGVFTDEDGKFTINVASNESITVSNIGYISQTFAIGNRTSITIELAADAVEIESMVVVGYGTQKRTDLVSSVSDVSGADIRMSGLNNVTHAIQDALPGVIATMNSGQPGADDASLTVRGASTYGSGGVNNPLILVDGVEVSGGFSAINPGEIASISVLKDASATSIYGSKGANGVILITTRRGEDGAPRVTFSGSMTAKTPVNLPDQACSYDALMLGQDAAKNSGASGINNVRSQEYVDSFLNPNRDQIMYPDIDWYDTMINPVGYESSARVTVSGGTENVKYFSSLSYDHVGDIIKVSNIKDTYDPSYTFDKFNFRTNLDFALTSTTDLRIDVAGRTSTQNRPTSDTNSIISAINGTTSYMMPLYYTSQFIKDHPDPLDPDAYLNGVRIANGGSMVPSQTSPYYMVNYYGFLKYTTQVVDLKAGLDQDLDFVTKGLKAFGTFNYSSTYTYRKRFGYLTAADGSTNAHDAEDLWAYDPATGSWMGSAYNEVSAPYHPADTESFQSASRNLFYEAKLTYDRTFGQKHNVAAVAVMNRTIYYGNIGDFAAYLENWVGRVSYNYDSRYFLELSAAYNGTDKFANGRKFGFFPALAVGYNIANESFIKDNLDFVDLFKLRYSYGVSGSEANAAKFMYEGGWSSKGGHGVFQPGYPIPGVRYRYYESKLANEEASWEEAFKTNYGVDAEFFNSKLTMSLDVYTESREGILIAAPSGTIYNPGFSTVVKVPKPKTNVGQMHSQGLEFVANYNGKINQDFSYSIGGNVNFADNRIIVSDDIAGEYEYLKNAGKPSGWIKGYQSTGYITNFEQQINYTDMATFWQGGNQPGTYAYTDFNLDGYIDADDMIPMDGTSQPLCVYGFNFGFQYKAWSFSARFYGKSGITYGSSSGYMYPIVTNGGIVAREEHIGNTWDFNNQDAKYPTPMSYVNNLSYSTNSLNLVNGSYLKLKSISVRYLLTSPFLQEKLKIQNASVYLTGDNLYSWSDLPYGDPEGGNALGSNYPLTRKFVVGVDLNF